MVSRCAATNANGKPCEAQPVRPSGYCWWHCPDASEERDRKRREGGANRSNKRRAAKALPSAAMTPTELQTFLSVVMKGTAAGRLDKGIAHAVAALGRTIAGLYPVTEFEQRLADMERQDGRPA